MPAASVEKIRTTGTDVFVALWKTYRALQAIVDEGASKIGLCDSDVRVLEALVEKGSLPINVIGAEVNLTTGSITTAVDRLEAKWLVVRRNHPTDRRMRIVELTMKGKRLVEKASAQQAKDMEAAMRVLSREQRLELLALLGQLQANREN